MAVHRCSTCGEEKPAAEFHKDSSKVLGVKSYCKVCAKKYWKARIERLKNDEGREHLRQLRANRAVSPVARARNRNTAAIARARWPQKEIARAAVRRAVERGDLVRPDHCEACGEPARRIRNGRSNIQAHHPDHSKVLEVQWLCTVCHAAAHLSAQQEKANG